MDTIHISLLIITWSLLIFLLFILNTPYLIIRSIFLICAIYRSKVNTSLKDKICLENIYFPSKFSKLCPESLKEYTDKISLGSDETQTFYWSFKYMSNYHLKYISTPILNSLSWNRNKYTQKKSTRYIKSVIWWPHICCKPYFLYQTDFCLVGSVLFRISVQYMRVAS